MNSIITFCADVCEDIEYIDLVYLESSSIKAFVCQGQLEVLLPKWADIARRENTAYTPELEEDMEHE